MTLGLGLSLWLAGQRCTTATSGLLPSGLRLAYLGDSIQAAGETAGSNGDPAMLKRSLSEVAVAHAIFPAFHMESWYDADRFVHGSPAGGTPLINGANLGLQGYTTQQLLDEMPYITDHLGWDLAYLNIGANDAVDGASAFATLETLVSTIKAAANPLLVGLIRPSGPTRAGAGSTWRQAIIDQNVRIAGLADEPGQTWLWNCAPAYDPGADGYLDATTDQVHPTTPGTVPAGISLAARLAEIIEPGNIFTGEYGSLTNLLGTMGVMTGSGGTANSPVTGQVASGWQVTRNGSNISVACSLEANAETGGQSQVFTITPAGSGTEYVQFRGNPIGFTASVANKWIQAWYEIELSASGDWQLPGLSFVENKSPLDSDHFSNVFTSDTSNRYDIGGRTLWISNEPRLFLADATGFRPDLRIYVNSTGSASTPIIAKLKRFVIAEVPSPITLWAP